MGLSAGTVKDLRHQHSRVRILEVGEIVLLMYRIERKTERRALRRLSEPPMVSTPCKVLVSI